MCAALMTGTVGAATLPGPITRTIFGTLVNILLTAGTASAGSLPLSTDRQFSWWPSTPPAALIVFTAERQPARSVGPVEASDPEKGSNTGTFSTEAALLVPIAAEATPAEARVPITHRTPTNTAPIERAVLVPFLGSARR